MKSICLLLSVTISDAIKMESMSQSTKASYPGEPYRAPYLEHVSKDLESNLKEQIPDSIPLEMDHIMCMFETYENSTEWQRRNCAQFMPAPPKKTYQLNTLAQGSVWGDLTVKTETDKAYCRCHKPDFSKGLSICNTGCGNPNQVCSAEFGCG